MLSAVQDDLVCIFENYLLLLLGPLLPEELDVRLIPFEQGRQLTIALSGKMLSHRGFKHVTCTIHYSFLGNPIFEKDIRARYILVIWLKSKLTVLLLRLMIQSFSEKTDPTS